MPIKLNDKEVRVLGVCIEKALSSPGSYPLTLNAMTLGANQKQNRDPVVNYTEAEIAQTVYSLQRKNLLKSANTLPGARANRFEHNVVEELHWDRREQAVMAELMLRGRQTAGELRTRATRMTPLDSLDAVGTALETLMPVDRPFVEELPREPGRSANRFRHLLSDSDTAPIVGAGSAVDERAAPGPPSSGGLPERVSRLEAKVAELTRIVDELQKNANVAVDGRQRTDV